MEMDKNASAEMRRLKQEFLDLERSNREERDSLVKAVNVLGTAMAAQPEMAVEWEALRRQIQAEGPLPLDGIEEGLKRIKDRLREKDGSAEGVFKELETLKEGLQEAGRAIRRMILSVVDELYPLTGEMKAKASSVEAHLKEESFGAKAAAEEFQAFVKSLGEKIHEDFKFVNSEFISLLNHVKELERTLAKDFGGEEYVKKVGYFEMKVNEEVSHIVNSFDLYSTVSEIKFAVVAKIENIKKMVLARKEEEMERLRSAQESILGLQKRMVEAEKTAFEMAKRAEEFHTAAMKDGLTRLYNRNALDLKLANALKGLAQGGSPFALILFDINEFKRINDTFGHVAGDKVLQKVAEVLNETFRKGDFIARFGGDEFAAVIGGMNEEMARERISSFRKNLGKRRFTSYKLGDIRVSVSAGIAVAMGEDTAETILNRADKAMYEEKSTR
jgi:diguanylate cyclase (GGDEF)-like protein